MAKGNDGNLMQHAVECDVIRHLADDQSTGELYLVTTHSMGPFEKLSDAGRPFSKKLTTWLDVASGKTLRFRSVDDDSLPAVVAAYRATHTSYLHYPNTATLATAMLGEERLTGWLSEKSVDTFDLLASACAGKRLIPLLGNWRDHLPRYKQAVPASPWMVSLDPFTYQPLGGGMGSDSPDFHDADFTLLEEIVTAYLKSNKPGAFCLFVYSLASEHEGLLETRFSDFCEELQLSPSTVRVQASFGRDHQERWHVGLLASNEKCVTESVKNNWSRVSEGPAVWFAE